VGGGAVEESAIEEILGFGEFALALAGFAAIALVLGRREGVLPPGSTYVVRFMVLNALGAALMAVFAFVLQRLEVPEPSLWRVCSAAYLLGATYFVIISVRQQRELSVAGEALLLPTALHRVIWGGSILAHLLQLSNFIGFPAPPSEGLFLLGLLVLIVLASIQFVALLFLALE
jgi:hypothetical protein